MLRAVAACALAFTLAASAGAQVGTAPDTTTWVTDGAVYAVARGGDRTFIGGDFSYVGPRTGSGVALAPVGAVGAGTPSPTFGSFPEVSGGRVMDVEVAPDGSWYIGGDFTHVGGVARGGLARIVPSGGALVLDGAFTPRADGPVRALALGVISGKDNHILYVGGKFDSINGDLKYRNLAALNRQTGTPALVMASPDDTVRSIDVLRPGSTGTSLPLVFVAGDFGQVGANPRNQLAAVWGVGASQLLAGTTTDFRPAAAGSGVRVVRVGTAARNAPTNDRVGVPVYLGGDFGLNTYKFDISLTDNTFTDPGGGYAFDVTGECTGCAVTVRALATSADGSVLYIGGRFTKLSTATVANLAAVNAVPNVYAVPAPTPAVKAWQPNPNAYVHALAPSPQAAGPLYIGGDFTHVGGAARLGLAAVSPATSAAQVGAWNPTASGGVPGETVGSVTALAASSSGVYAGGSFTSVGATPHENVAALDSTGRPIDGWNASTNGRVNALAVGNGRLYLGGRFDHASGQPRMRLAAVDALGSGALDGQFKPAAEPACTEPGCVRSEVLTLSLRDNALYVGGAFARLAGSTRANAGAVDGSTGAALGWAPNPNDNVYSLLATCGTVYAGGSFGQAGGRNRRRLAALDPQTGAATSWNPSVEAGSAVRAIARDADVVYVGGNFGQVGGAPRPDLAALDADTGEATGWNPTVSRPGEEVWALAAPPEGSVVYAGGRFTRAGRADRENVAAFDRGTGDATSWNPGADAPVRALAADGGWLAAGGDFRQLGPLTQQGIATFGFGSGTEAGTARCEPLPPEKPPPPLAPRPPARSERAADTTPPRLAHVRLSHRRFRTARRATRDSQASADKGTHVGTTFKYGLSERAVVRYTFKRKTRIRCRSAKWRRACESWPRGDANIFCRSHRWERRCYRWRRVGSMRHFSRGGKVRRQFDGQIGRRWLRPGKYRVKLRAVDLAKNRSSPVRRRFRVVRR